MIKRFTILRTIIIVTLQSNIASINAQHLNFGYPTKFAEDVFIALKSGDIQLIKTHLLTEDDILTFIKQSDHISQIEKDKELAKFDRNEFLKIIEDFKLKFYDTYSEAKKHGVTWGKAVFSGCNYEIYGPTGGVPFGSIEINFECEVSEYQIKIYCCKYPREWILLRINFIVPSSNIDEIDIEEPVVEVETSLDIDDPYNYLYEINQNIGSTTFNEINGTYRIGGDHIYTKDLVVEKETETKFLFSLKTFHKNGCKGAIVDGHAILKNGAWYYTSELCNELKFVFLPGSVIISEQNCEEHGNICDFEGRYIKVH